MNYQIWIPQIRIFFTYNPKLELKFLFMMLFMILLVRSAQVLKVIKKE